MARRKSFRAVRGRQRVPAPGRMLHLSPLARCLRFEPLEDRRLLAVLTVNSSLDNLTGGDGLVTLREAIVAANTDATTDLGHTGSGADTIAFDAALSGATITLGGTQLAITQALVIDARPLAANVTIDANELSRIFNITATTGDFTLGGLTLTGGKTTVNSSAGFGGAIRSLTTGNLTLDQSTISGNSTTGNFAYGGGIFAKGTVTLTQSTINGNSTGGQDARGGGVFSYGAVTLTQSTVSGNSTSGTSAYGGGIRAGGAVTLTESTVSGNSTAGSNAKGGGIWTYNTVTLTQSTLSGNSTTGYLAHGGGIWAYGAVTLTQSTVTENHALNAAANPAMGGGVFQFNTGFNHAFSISGSIVAANTAGGSGADLIKDPQSTLTVNYSLIGTGIAPSAGGNNVVTNAPQLGPLANNGGPTQTHAPLFGSPAINAGDPSVDFNPAEFDQRGAPFTRARGGRIDIGAHENEFVELPEQGLVVDTTGDLVDGDFTVGNLSLREAIVLANFNSGANTITFTAVLSDQTITLNGTELVITEALLIDARPLAANVTIDANELSRIFHITATTGDFTLGALTLTGGRTTGNNTFPDTIFSGGAIRSLTTGNLTLDQSTVSGNSTNGNRASGGGIVSLGAVTLTQSTVSGNSTAGTSATGGGISAVGTVTLTQSTVSGNSTAGNGARGGGIAASGSVTLIQSTVSGNSTWESYADGGGISAYGTVTLTQSTVSENSTLGYLARGGGISAGTVTLTESTVSGNSTNGNRASGGGIVSLGAVTLTQSTVSGNSTAGTSATGGGISAVGTVTLTQSTVSGNSTYSAAGGGIGAHGAVTLTQSTVTDNLIMLAPAMAGGGVHQFNTADHPFSISGSIVAGNLATGSGADLVKDPGSTLTVNYSLIGVTPAGGFVGSNNITGLDPLLGGLVNNGGPTETHALLAGSPAIDIGDPSIVFNAAEFDQRGAPFVRVFDGDGAGGARIDMGAYERQTVAGLNLVVDTAADEYDGDHSVGDLSLREAIVQANANPDSDTITFAAALSGATITLGGTELAIGEALVIDARPLAAGVTIDANEQSRIFNIKATTGDFTLGGLTLTGGRTSGNFTFPDTTFFSGGAIRSLTTGNLTLDQSTVSGNSTTGNGAHGGGIFSEGAVTLTQSTVSGNSTTASNAKGGGISSEGAVTLTQSTVSGNSSNFHGGGISSEAAVTLMQSTVSGNSGNTRGGGIWSKNAVTLTQSTITENHAPDVFAMGGGVFQYNTGANHPFSISSSIVAGNTTGGSGPDVVPDPQSTLSVNYSLIGTGITPTAGGNNVVTNNPQLGPLANNGGPTQTHALMAGSLAIDAGDPGFMGPPDFDQRGFAYSRVIGGRIDMGAFEFGAVSADFNEDGTVSGLDFLAWQRGFGIAAPNAIRADGDADNDTDVDGADLAFWELQYGTPPGPLIAAVSAAAFASEGPALASWEGSDQSPFATNQDAIDVAIAVSLLENSSDDTEETLMDDPPAAVEASYDSAFNASDSVPAANRSVESDFPATRSFESEDVQHPWLSDELLERVFG